MLLIVPGGKTPRLYGEVLSCHGAVRYGRCELVRQHQYTVTRSVMKSRCGFSRQNRALLFSTRKIDATQVMKFCDASPDGLLLKWDHSPG